MFDLIVKFLIERNEIKGIDSHSKKLGKPKNHIYCMPLYVIAPSLLHCSSANSDALDSYKSPHISETILSK